MMNYQSIKKWSLRFVLLSLVLTMASLFWINNQINQMWGGNTTVVDPDLFQSPQQKIAIINVSVLSADGTQMLDHQTVLIDAGKITSIDASIDYPKDALLIDGQGKYLIPGLIDSHVHLWQSPNDLLLYIANGVTHIRELNGSDEHIIWREEIKQGRMGPDMFVASSRFNSSGLFKGLFDRWAAKIATVNTLNRAETLVQSFYDKGYDAIKIYTFLNEADFSVVSAAAEKLGMPIIGHIPITIGFEAFWNSRQKELAHSEEIVKELNREFGGYNDPTVAEFLMFVEERSEEVVGRLLKNNVAVVSTLSLMESFSSQKSDLDSQLQHVELSYVNPGISEGTPLAEKVMGWLPESNIYRLTHDHTAEQLMANKVYWDTYAKASQTLLQAMAQSGVKVLAGTDANVPVMVPGFSIHEELKSLTLAGMTNTQALLAATAVPADWMKIKTGRLAASYQADLLLLNNNPLDDIEHTKSIDAVIVNGRLIQHDQIKNMLKAVKEANDQSRTVDVSYYEL